MIHFLAAAVAFLAAGFDLGAAAFFGLGAFGFLVGGLALFFAFGAALLEPLAGAADFLAAAGFFLAAAAFLSLAAEADFAFEGDAEAEAAEADFLLAAAADAEGFFALEAARPDEPVEDFAPAGFFDEDEDFDSSLNEPEAPLPLV